MGRRGRSQTTGNKRQRERDKAQKRREKAERKQERQEAKESGTFHNEPGVGEPREVDEGRDEDGGDEEE